MENESLNLLHSSKSTHWSGPNPPRIFRSSCSMPISLQSSINSCSSFAPILCAYTTAKRSSSAFSAAPAPSPISDISRSQTSCVQAVRAFMH